MDILEMVKGWQRAGIWREIEPLRDTMIKEARRSGMDRETARTQVYTELLAKFPQAPPEAEERSEAGGGANLSESTNGAPDSGTHTRDEAAVSGLDQVPESWPDLPPNAKLSVEIQWVQANRLRIVRDTASGCTVDLSAAMTPAPSWSALGWLETSIRAYAKFVDVAAKASATAEDERETTRRERMAIEEIRSLLAEMVAE